MRGGEGPRQSPHVDLSLGRSRDLRRRQTDAEAALWRHLRRRGLVGLKFRRQHPIHGYIVDFFCSEARLAVELDGGQHAEAFARDVLRTQELERRGIRVVRFWNTDVLREPLAVLQRILEEARTPSP